MREGGSANGVPSADTEDGAIVDDCEASARPKGRPLALVDCRGHNNTMFESFDQLCSAVLSGNLCCRHEEQAWLCVVNTITA